jgi:dienelactone hydrolase
MGFCIGNPLIWNLIKRVPDRVVAAVSAQPSAVDPQNPNLFYDRNLAKWGPALCARRPEITMDQVKKFLNKLYMNVDFVVTVSRDFVRNCPTPLLVLPDNTDSHPYAAAMEMANLAPNSQVSLYPWKDTRENTQLAVKHIRTFLQTQRQATETKEAKRQFIGGRTAGDI